MRFIGNKTKLLSYIDDILSKNNALPGERFFDFFAGTASVGKYFKEKGYTVTSSDILYFSYVLQQAYIHNSKEPSFDKLGKFISNKLAPRLMSTPYEEVLDYLNSIQGTEGYIYKNFTEEGTKTTPTPRKFFKGDNGKKIDAIRQTIEGWKKKGLLSKNEYFILLATLIESVPFYANISGVYGAFLKSYDPRAKKDLRLRPLSLSTKGPVGSAFNRNSMELVNSIETDTLYLDPPYNARQYAPNYHLLETIAEYDDPEIKGVAGIRPYNNQKSEFCNPATALEALGKIAGGAKYKVLVLSYNSEGIMPQKKILEVLSKHGNAKIYEVDYRRFKSNSNGNAEHKTHIKEQLYVLKRA
ncbi:DNA methyltransferase [candidate division WWE3 bacterium RIFCSPHIGHO2_01_FULL_42_13]|uniref:site-specific DNA-methyltransferase (adenine-specific) n=1 Tax=candidate division WWE3 bacterium RIFCSPHIGHO2_01_FULL_42_13 TaxID=1802617 RepID=A0A1F4USN1_UNCKA|nr:MAG: DNA methyltransferase [candidate division WWE3 bacterium RIFCSPHIGHO2_01_FULL_42_13]